MTVQARSIAQELEQLGYAGASMYVAGIPQKCDDALKSLGTDTFDQHLAHMMLKAAADGTKT